MKYYMNNPCEVIKEVTDDFVEIKVYPKFNDDVEGRYWCTECLVGNSGTPTRHTCGDYQEVIDALEDVSNTMIVIVEKRLLASEPIEFKGIKLLENKKDNLTNDVSVLQTQQREYSNTIELNKKELISSQEELVSIKNEIEKQNALLEVAKEKLTDYNNITVNIIDIPKINISLSELKSLIQDRIILQSLEAGGADNWEWYSESIIKDEELEASIINALLDY